MKDYYYDVNKPKDNDLDGLEVFVKIKLGIALTEREQEIYDSYDKEEKVIINDYLECLLHAPEGEMLVENVMNQKMK